ncbi:MAG: kinase/pyrophosphorylase [Coxiellaceae bacterium]|nr:kinase/pyrophosphorylase [Coxiellaceae bacterium]
MTQERHVFCLSDGTGITAQTLGQSLLTQFDNIKFVQVNIPYVDTEEKANEVLKQIQEIYRDTHKDPIIFTTIIQKNISKIIHQAPGVVLDFLQSFIGPLEETLGEKSSHTIGRSHSMTNYEKYKKRIDALNFSLNTDDGACTHQYANADLILVGVSRCGKTPTSLYLALNQSIFVGNYPITEEDLDSFMLPKSLQKYSDKLFGLTIDVERLMAIRNERRPDSRYASRKQCEHEIKRVEKLFKRERIPHLNSTHLSIEELATRIMAAKHL